MSSIPTFQCLYCSSEDVGHPFEYLFRSDIVSGWISARNPQFPIEAVIDLKGRFILTGLEVASHQFMIATRVDLYGTKNENFDENCIWESIGFFTFNSNQRSQWQARELKRIKINHCRYRYLRMEFHECHLTPPNTFSQVSLISLEIQGRRDIKPRMTSLDDMMNDIQSSKQAAVDEENYAAAADFKEQLDNINLHKNEIEELFQKKKEALENEQYLLVDSIINNIMGIISPSLNEYEGNQSIQNNQIQPSPRLPKQKDPVYEPEPEMEPENEINTEITDNEDNRQTDPNSFFLTEFRDDSKVMAPSQDILQITLPADDLPESPHKSKVTHISIKHPDDEPLPINNDLQLNNDLLQDDNDQPPSLPPPKPKKVVKKVMMKEKVPTFKNPASNIMSSNVTSRRQVPNFAKEPPKTDEPDPLSEENRAEAEPLISLFGESAVAAAYSNGWSCKVSGYHKLCELTKGLKTNKEKTTAFRGMLPLIRSRFSDGLKAVYCSAVEETISLLETINTDLPPQEFGRFISQILPLVIGKLGDSNARIDESAHQFAMWAMENDKLAFQEIIQYSLKAPGPSQYHLWIAKLKIIKVVIEKHGIGTGGKLNVNEVMKMVTPCLESRKAEVRQQAFELLLQIYPVVGSQQMEKYISSAPRLVKEQFKAAIAGQ